MLAALKDVAGWTVVFAVGLFFIVYLVVGVCLAGSMLLTAALERIGLGSPRSMRRAMRIAEQEDHNYDRDGIRIFGEYGTRHYYTSHFDRVYPVDGPYVGFGRGKGEVCVTRTVNRQGERKDWRYGRVIFCDRSGYPLKKPPKWCAGANPTDYWPTNAPTKVPRGPVAADRSWPAEVEFPERC